MNKNFISGKSNFTVLNEYRIKGKLNGSQRCREQQRTEVKSYQNGGVQIFNALLSEIKI